LSPTPHVDLSRRLAGLRRTNLPAPVWRGARLVVLALVIGTGINHLYWSLTDWNLVDMQVYWDAALRLRAGEPLYEPGVDTFHAYRYAPWFAIAWVPLTYVPQGLVGVVWSGLLLATSLVLVWPLVRQGTTFSLLLAALMLPLLVPMASGGNVQPLLVAALYYGIPRRSGPLWIALAASLKIVPILFVLLYVARRQWLQATVTAVLTGALLAPALLFGLSRSTVDSGPVAALLAISPVLYVVAVILAIVAVLIVAVRIPRYGALACAGAAQVALPRLFLSDLTLLLAGISETHRSADQADRREGLSQRAQPAETQSPR
jgi:hypothetical protein